MTRIQNGTIIMVTSKNCFPMLSVSQKSVGLMLLFQMFVDQMSVNEINEMSIGQMSVNGMSMVRMSVG